MSAPYNDEQRLERLLRDLYDTTYEASTLPTPASVWEGVVGRLALASQADHAQNHAQPIAPTITDRLLAPDDVAVANGMADLVGPSDSGNDKDAAEVASPMTPDTPMTPMARATANAAPVPSAAPAPNYARPSAAWRSAPRPWTLPRVVAPVVAAALIVSLLVGVFVALGFRRGAQPPVGATHACLQPAATTASGVMALSLNSGDTVLLRASDGKQLWRVHTGFPTNTPVIVGGVVYVLARNNDVIALRVGDGTQIWNTLVASETNFGLAEPEPLVVDCGVVLVNTANGGIEALRASDGARLWSYQDYPAPTNTPGVAYPYMGTTGLLTAGDGVVYALSQRVSGGPLTKTLTWTIKAFRETDGHLLWQRQPAQPDDPYRQANTNAHMQIQLVGAPYTGVVLGHTLYLLQYSAHPSLMAFTGQSGAPLWQKAMPSNISIYQSLYGSLVVAGAYLYLAQTNQVCQLAPNDGSSQRCYQTTAYGAVGAITRDTLYVPTAGQTDPSVTISAIRARDGRRLWTWDVPRIGSFFPTLVYQGSVATTDVVGFVTSVAIYGVRASDGYRLWSWSPPGALTSPTTDSNDITGVTAG
ncbi:MAG TPA: PQQ-binding-like beta-propeller repeat protein [Ktedonobacterales bacterium]|nr:PQQ-binding-like beta-propeller repeat protein [Ktedonobacterales bacterium]